MFLLQFFIVVLCLFFGTKKGGVNLGLYSALGLGLLYLIFDIELSQPPVTIILLILSIIIVTSAVEACGGLQLLIEHASRLIRSNPRRINLYAPLICYSLTLLSGTGHIIYSLLTVITESSKQHGLRPETPLSMSVIASQQAIVASPLSASTILMFSILSPYDVQLTDILMICLPATILSTLTMILIIPKIKKQRLESAASVSPHLSRPLNKPNNNPLPFAKRSLFIFFGSVMASILLCINIGQTTAANTTTSSTIQMFLLAAAGLIVIFCKISGTEILKQDVFSKGLQAIIAIIGVSWLGDSFIQTHKDVLLGSTFHIIERYPWSFCFFSFAMSIILFSQSVTVQLMYPLALSLGFSPYLLIAFVPSVCGYFFIPNYPTILAAIQFDSTGSTKVGSYLLNHSFMIPGLVSCSASIGYALLFTYLRFSL